jgi:dynactin complex subunit
MVNGRMAVVRFLGPTQFAEGTWLGVAFDDPVGKHDGLVDGHRYFTAKPAHGLFVRPNKATCRGISVAELLERA